MKPLWQNVEQEAADELVGADRHCPVPRLSVAAVILVAKGHAAPVERNEPAVRDGDAVGVTGEIGKHRFGPGEGRLGIDEPVLPPQWREMRGEGLATAQASGLAEEAQPAGRVGVSEGGQEEPPEQAGAAAAREPKNRPAAAAAR